MTIDQRLEFLVQSTESLHATTALHSEQIAEITTALGRLERKFEQMASTLSDVAILALNHERRLGKLDGGSESTA